MYIYIHLFITLINIVPEKNEKKKNLKRYSILVILLVTVTFFLANCELNHTLFWCIWGICPNLRKLLKHVS